MEVFPAMHGDTPMKLHATSLAYIVAQGTRMKFAA